ncbi:alkaline phosphatase PhoX [Neolewinella agarilytica]|uniref:alkaline phosphatase PhoX n=1 Tax=Neolewinella agarilytica TaxID=478744 RepID=UPI00235542D4|nr:alkaline phosphatase PhoX [Neolewinella agarilytica]
MRTFYLSLLLVVSGISSLNAQLVFPFEIDAPEGYTPTRVTMPGSPLSLQVLFIGGTDMVQTTATYGNEAGQTHAKEWHDFIGFTPDDSDESMGWVSVSHESIYRDDRIGDGGGMTAFRVKRDEITGDLVVLDQELEDGREGKFFNVDFANTVGETGMNCGGISSVVDGRIWTAEEWFRSSNSSINNGRFTNNNALGAGPYGISYNEDGGTNTANQGVRDLRPFVVDAPEFPFIDGDTLQKYENFNWMVEIDPREAKAIRKQYNFGRQGFEGGTVSTDNKYIYLGIDATPAPWVRFVAETPGDFTKGEIQVYKHDADEKWITIEETKSNMMDFSTQALAVGATMYNRNEWVAIDKESGIIYWTETGRDAPGSRFAGGVAAGGVIAPHHLELAAEQTARVQEVFPDSTITADGAGYRDYYGRVLGYNPETEEVFVVINGGPYFEESPTQDNYPSKHLSNPDGLNVMYIDDNPFLVICEDLNGETFGRMPFENTSDGAAAGLGIRHRMCELFLLDLNTENATTEDLIRLTVTPVGAEITGAMPTPDGKSLLVNSQHPSGANEFPFNHSLTFAIHGFNELTVSNLAGPDITEQDEFTVFPNPTLQEVHFNKMQDIALYNTNGQRLRVYRNVSRIDVSRLPAGLYFLRNAEGKVIELVKQ